MESPLPATYPFHTSHIPINKYLLIKLKCPTQYNASERRNEKTNLQNAVEPFHNDWLIPLWSTHIHIKKLLSIKLKCGDSKQQEKKKEDEEEEEEEEGEEKKRRNKPGHLRIYNTKKKKNIWNKDLDHPEDKPEYFFLSFLFFQPY